MPIREAAAISDIFISYASEDRKKAESLERHLAHQGWSVWRDERLEIGVKYPKAIRRELHKANCVVVLWSAASLNSDWVYDEANEVADRGVLVPACLERVEPPMGFGTTQYADLAGWEGDPADPRLGALVDAIATKLEPATEEAISQAVANTIAQLHAPLLTIGPDAKVGQVARLATLFAVALDQDPRAGQDLFEDLIKLVRDAAPGSVLRLEGHAGTGTSALLGCLYGYQLMRYRHAADRELFPILLHLREYDQSPDPEPYLRRHLQRISRYADEHPTTEVIVFLDGLDRFAEHRAPLEMQAIAATMGYRRVIAVNLGVPENGSALLMERPLPLTEVACRRLRGFDPRTGRASALTRAFASVAGGPPSHDLEQLQANVRFSRVSLGTLSATHKMASYPQLLHAGHYFKHYVTTELLPRYAAGRSNPALDLDAAACYAYNFTINHVVASLDEQTQPEWLLAHHGVDVRDFLVAYRVAQCAMKPQPDAEEIAVLKHRYTKEIMKFTSDILNTTASDQMAFVECAEAILESGAADPAANLSYLLGRLDHSPARQAARARLRSTKEHFLDRLKRRAPTIANGEVEDLLLSLRSIFVSLIYLGDSDSSDEYIGRLLADPRWNHINRAFHLEYYRDVTIVPPLFKHEDTVLPFPKTYGWLNAKIAEGLTGQRQSSFDLDVFTLFSLAQHRLEQQSLEPDVRRTLVELCDQVREAVMSRDLRRYLGLMSEHLTTGSIDTGAVAEALYRIKTTTRTGWVQRGIRDVESVADHMYGAFLLAFTYLPLDDDEPEYERDRIMKMLLVHDLAESKTGDIPNKNQTQERQESAWYQDAACLATYTDLHGLSELGDLWDEYRRQATLNAHIARDFDKLDQLTQLYIYARTNLITDFDSWEIEIEQELRTKHGHRVFKILRDHFEQERAPAE